jgi:hypothetical protein
MSGTTSETPAPEATAPAAPTTSGRSRASQAVATSAVDAAVIAAVQAATADLEARNAGLEVELAAIRIQLADALASIPAPVVTPAVPTGTVTVTNTSGFGLIVTSPKTHPGVTHAFSSGKTSGIPAAFWADWLAVNADSDIIKSGLISAKAD